MERDHAVKQSDRDLTKMVVPMTAVVTIATATWYLSSSLHAVDSQLQSLRFELQEIRRMNERTVQRDEFRAWIFKLASDNPTIKVSELR